MRREGNIATCHAFTAPVVDEARPSVKGWMLRALRVAVLALAGCGGDPGSDSGADTDTVGGPMPPDLGADAVVCGAPADWASQDEQIAALAGCEVYEGSLYIHESILDLSPLSSLRIIRGHVTSTSKNDETLEGLDALEWVGSFHFSDAKLQDLSALGNLTGVDDYFELIALEELESLHGLEGLQFVGGGVKLEANPGLTDLEGLSGLERIDGDLTIWANENLASLDGLSALQSVGGNVTIRLNPQLLPTEVDAFLDRVEIDGVVTLD